MPGELRGGGLGRLLARYPGKHDNVAVMNDRGAAVQPVGRDDLRGPDQSAERRCARPLPAWSDQQELAAFGQVEPQDAAVPGELALARSSGRQDVGERVALQ